MEATGRLKDGDREILIMDIGQGGAAELAGLQIGDRITKIDNKIPEKFSKKTDAGLSGPQELLGKRLDQKAGLSNSKLSLEVSRGEKTHKLNIQLPKSQSFLYQPPSLVPKKKFSFRN